MKNMTLETITKVCGGVYVGDPTFKTREIGGAVIDSRLVEKDDLFIPIRGARVDGHTFIPAVFEKGALATLCESRPECFCTPYILVDSCEAAMKKLAEYYRASLGIKVVGITGSVGKTSTKEMIAAVLSQKYKVLKTEGNRNNELGLPLTVFKIRQEHEVAVLEMGISEFGEMDRLAQMARPDICVITNIGLCHLENLQDRDGVLRAKTESFAHLSEDGIAVLNGDDDKLCHCTQVNGRPAVFYGIERVSKEGAKREVYATDIEPLGILGVRANIHIGEENFFVDIPIAGEHNVYNALAAVCVGRQLGLSTEEMKRGIASVQTIGGRSNLMQSGGLTVIDDCYNANPVSMKAAIDVLSQASGRKIAVLGDMGELGKEERTLHAVVGEHFAGKEIDALFCTGSLARELAVTAERHSPKTKVSWFATREELLRALCDFVKTGDTVLVKASHFMGFSEIVKSLCKDRRDA